jgi:hypothetical protein
MSDFNQVFEALLEEGTRKFSKAHPSDAKLYGKLNGQDELLAFCRYIDQDYPTPDHVIKIAEHLEAVERGEIPRLLVTIPPRFGKSELCSRKFPAWALGRKPKREIMITSYNDEKAESFSKSARDIVESDKFRDIFPDVAVSQSKRAMSEWHTTAGGVVIAAGAGGALTGGGANIALIDDPVKNWEDALSEALQEKKYNWYKSVLRTRLYPGSAIILILTRWVTYDLAGRILEHEKTVEKGGKWVHLNLPLLDAQGNSLWPEMYDDKEIADIRETVGEKIFQALYQQEPIDVVERIFSDPQFAEPPRNMRLVAYLDPAFGGKDYTAFSAGGMDRIAGDDTLIYVTAGKIWRGTLDHTYSKVERYCHEMGITTLYVESNQAQVAVAKEFQRRGIRVKEVPSTINKNVRIINNVKLNWKDIRFSRSVDQDYLKQIISYSEEAQHDDAPDSLSGLVSALKPGRQSLNARLDGFGGSMFGIFGR